MIPECRNVLRFLDLRFDARRRPIRQAENEHEQNIFGGCLLLKDGQRSSQVAEMG